MITNEQWEQRRSGLGGSDAAAICGLSRYKSPLDVYLEKVEGFYNTDNNEAIHFGNILEPVIGEEYARRTNSTLIKFEFPFKAKENFFMFANIDFFVKEKDKVLECKTASSYKKDEWGYEGTDFIPDEYLMQCVHYAHVLDVEHVDVAVLIGGQDFRIFTYKRNKELEKNLIDLEKSFWLDNVEKRIPPAPSNMNDLSRLWPQSKESTKIVTNDVTTILIEDYKRNKSTIKKLEEENEQIKIGILKHIQDNELLVDENGKKIASYKSQIKKTLDLGTLKDKYIDIYEECLKESSFRVFRV